MCVYVCLQLPSNSASESDQFIIMSLGNYELVQPYIDDKNGTRLIGITSSSPASVRQPQVLPPQQQQQLHPNAQSAAGGFMAGGNNGGSSLSRPQQSYPYSQVYHIDLVSTSKSNMKLNCNAFSNHLHTTEAIMSVPQTANPRTTDGVVIRVSSLLSMTLVLNPKKSNNNTKPPFH